MGDPEAEPFPPLLWSHVAGLVGLLEPEVAEERLLMAWDESELKPATARRPIALWLVEHNEAMERPEDAAFWREEAAAQPR